MVWLTPTRRFGVTRGRWLRWSPTSLSVLILRRRCMWVLPTLMLLRRWRSWSAYCWPLTAMWTLASEGWWVLLLEPTPALGRRLSPSLSNVSAGRRWNPLAPWVGADQQAGGAAVATYLQAGHCPCGPCRAGDDLEGSWACN